MSLDEKAHLSLIVLGLLLIAFGIGHGLSESRYKSQAIERGYARYHPTTGDWEWIERTSATACEVKP